MSARLEMDWSTSKITDCLLLEVFNRAAKQLTGLTLHEHTDGRTLIFIDAHGAIRHVLANLDDNSWACFCPNAWEGECAATVFARVRKGV